MKAIIGFQDKYTISENGDVYSKERFIKHARNKIRRIRAKKLKQSLSESGYYCVNLFCDETKKQKTYFVHRLVAEAFFGFKEMQVDHIDGDKKNNSINNLEYVTPSENTKRAYKLKLANGLIGEKNPNSKLTNTEREAIAESNKKTKELASIYNVSERLIRHIKAKYRGEK